MNRYQRRKYGRISEPSSAPPRGVRWQVYVIAFVLVAVVLYVRVFVIKR